MSNQYLAIYSSASSSTGTVYVPTRNTTSFGPLANANGSWSIAMGYNAAGTGEYAISIGSHSVASYDNSIAIGYTAKGLDIKTVAIGYNANAYYGNCISIGANALSRQVNSIAIGVNVCAGACHSIAIGQNSRAMGNYSIAIGSNHNASLYTHANGIYSIAIGHCANASQNGVAIGGNAQANGTTGCVALGFAAQARGNLSVAIGFGSTAQGNYSTAVGRSASASGTGATAIGYLANAAYDYSTALGYSAQTTAANAIQLGSSSSLSLLKCRVALTVTSDKRDKTNITPITDALAFLNKLEPVTYVYNHRENYIDRDNMTEQDKENFAKYNICNYDKEAHAKGIYKDVRRRSGLRAQNILEALSEVYHSDNYANIVDDNFYDFTDKEKAVIPEDIENQLAVNYSAIIPFLVEAVQELTDKITRIKQKKQQLERSVVI